MSEKLQKKAELISALVDGELCGAEFANALDYLGNSAAASEVWDTYHLVGQVMRSAPEPVCLHDALFVQRLRLKMAQITPELIAVEALSTSSSGKYNVFHGASNDAWWRRIAGLASVALVGVLAWQGVSQLGSGSSAGGASQLALAGNPGSSEVMIRDPQLDALLAAHRQIGGATGLQRSSGFLRNASFKVGQL
ncbi:hypothetical protein GALL_406910 [mine drainage metagenome]|uniref:Anti sigma-E protein RseA N-terminal domain-containing protein n=1 Tax=mine drainage metagenome TaxID=410659 RepID=A0A1J5QNS3_9ZZZZ